MTIDDMETEKEVANGPPVGQGLEGINHHPTRGVVETTSRDEWKRLGLPIPEQNDDRGDADWKQNRAIRANEMACAHRGPSREQPSRCTFRRSCASKHDEKE